MLRTSCRLTAAMAGVVTSIGVASTEALESKTSENLTVSASARLCCPTKNSLSPNSLNLLPVVENGAASLGPGRDNLTVTTTVDMSTVDGREEAVDRGDDIKQDKEDCGEQFELLEVDVVRPNEQGRQQAEADKLKAAITKARDLCWCKMYESGTPGMIVGIAVNGKLVWQHGFGYSDVENKLLAGTGCVMRYAFCENQYYYVSHTGGAIGASSVLLIAPNKTPAGETRLPQGVVVAVLANLQGVGLNKLAKSIAQAFEGLSMEKPVRVQKVYQC